MPVCEIDLRVGGRYRQLGRTTVTITTLYASRAAREAVLKTRMADGMEAGYARLDALLAARTA